MGIGLTHTDYCAVPFSLLLYVLELQLYHRVDYYQPVYYTELVYSRHSMY